MLEEADDDETGALALCFSARDVGARLRVYRPRYADWIIATVVGFKRDASEALSQRALNARDTPYVLVCFCFLRRDTHPSHVLTTPPRLSLSLSLSLSLALSSLSLSLSLSLYPRLLLSRFRMCRLAALLRARQAGADSPAHRGQKMHQLRYEGNRSGPRSQHDAASWVRLRNMNFVVLELPSASTPRAGSLSPRASAAARRAAEVSAAACIGRPAASMCAPRCYA